MRWIEQLGGWAGIGRAERLIMGWYNQRVAVGGTKDLTKKP